MRERFVNPASSYEEFWSQIDFRKMDIPEQFNLGVACLDEHGENNIALTVVSRDKSHRSYTFGELKDRANRLANALNRLGIGKGDVVALQKPQSLETAVAYLAIFRMGAIALPLSSLFGPDAIEYRLRDGRAKAVICSAENAPKVREAVAGSDVVLILVGGDAQAGEQGYDDMLASASAQFDPVGVHKEDPAFLIYTSGTTGNPKGALHAHRTVFGQIPVYQGVYEFYPQPGDVFWSPADWAWIAGLMALLVPAWFYGLPVVVDLEGDFSAERAVWLMREHNVTLALLPPTALRMIRAAGLPGAGFSLRAVLTGAEVVGAELRQWAEDFLGCTVNEAYGQTEFNGLIGNCASVYPVKPGSLGRALPGTTAAVVDDKGEPVVGQEGEIAVDRHHPLTLLEYWRNPEATREKFIGDWLLTGDLGVQDEDGYFWFVSRKDDVIKSSGYRIGPGEIEGCLGSHEAVAMAAVIGVPDKRKGQVPKAFVVLRPGVEPSDALVEELRGHVRTRLAPHEVPREVVFLDDLPKTPTGKIMRRVLRE